MAEKKSVTSNVLWRFLEQCGAQGTTFIVTIVLSRILEPEIYGLIALVTVFLSIFQVFIESGLGNSLIQKKNADDLDFSTVFFTNIILCILIYLFLFWGSIPIATYYNNTDLILIIRVLSITILISGVKNVLQAYVSRELIFKKFFFATISGTVISGIAGIILAYNGFGIWALVVQSLGNQIIDTVLLWFIIEWRPKLIFSFKRLKGLCSYGWKILVASLLDTIYLEIQQLIIGKMYSKDKLAFYNKGLSFSKLIVLNIDAAARSVMFPVMASCQDDSEKVKYYVKNVVKLNTYVICPMMFGLFACADTFITVLLTEKWLPCVPYLRVFCIAYSFVVFNTANQNSYKALGRSDIYLRNEILQKVIGTVILLTTMFRGVFALAIGLLATMLLTSIVNSLPNKKLINYGFFNQFADMVPALILSITMSGFVYLISFININSLMTLLVQVVFGFCYYIFMSRLFRIDSYFVLINILKNNIIKKIKFREVN